MNGLNQQDLDILSYYAGRDNRELYWNYLATRPGSDGYGLLALGVVRNDNVPGAVANAFADAEAKRAGVDLSEREWNSFGVDLMERDLRLRREQFDAGRPELALNLPVRQVMQVHDEAFIDAGIPINAWTPREYLAAAREHGEKEAGPTASDAQREAAGQQEMERGWTMMLDNRSFGLARGGETARNIVGRYRDELADPDNYLARLAGARTDAMVSRSNQDPDRIGASTIYQQRRADGRWFLIDDTVSMSGLSRLPVEERDPARLRELEDTRALRLEIRDRRDDFHPLDSNGQLSPDDRIRASPRTLADADDAIRVSPTRHAASMDQPDSPDHRLYLQGRSAVERMEAGLGRGFDGNSEKLAQAATVLARQGGMARIDHALLSIDNGRGVRVGEHFFVVQGQPEDPAHERAMVKTTEALNRVPTQNEQLLAEAREQQAQRALAQENERAQNPARDNPARSVG